MKSLFFEMTQMTPEINFDCNSGIFVISGKSIPENASDFYRPVLEWLEGYVSSPLQNTVLKMYPDYFNTSSSKYFLDIFRKLEQVYRQHNQVVIEWYYEEDDEDMLETGEDYGMLLRIPFVTRVKTP